MVAPEEASLVGHSQLLLLLCQGLFSFPEFGRLHHSLLLTCRMMVEHYHRKLQISMKRSFRSSLHHSSTYRRYNVQPGGNRSSGS